MCPRHTEGFAGNNGDTIIFKQTVGKIYGRHTVLKVLPNVRKEIKRALGL